MMQMAHVYLAVGLRMHGDVLPCCHTFIIWCLCKRRDKSALHEVFLCCCVVLLTAQTVVNSRGWITIMC
jgi:hypothetical protein